MRKDAQNRICLVMDLAEGGELFERLTEGPVDEGANAVVISKLHVPNG